MSHRALIIIGFLFFLQTENFSQDYFSYGGGNFCGLNQLMSNPAAAADNRLKLDVMLGGADFTFNNSWFAIKRAALTPSGSIGNPAGLKFPFTWQNVTPGVPDNVYKNFKAIDAATDHAIIVENRILMPSVLYSLNSKNAIALTWSVRQIANLEGVSKQLSTLFENELDFNVTQNNRIQNKNLGFMQMTWAEYGLTYARVLKDDNQHFIKAGVTPKLLQGLESAYLGIHDLDFFLSNTDTSSYFKANILYGHSANYNSPISNGRFDRSFYRFVSKPGLGLDLGVVYEWRPNHQKFKYKVDGQTVHWRNDLNKYKLKFGLSVVDIGKITFDKQGNYNDLRLSVTNSDMRTFINLGSITRFDSLLRADYSNPNQKSQYSVLLPTALNSQLDFAFNRFFYANLSAHIGNFYKANFYRIHNYSAICFAPRIEHYWFNVSIPFTYNALSADRFQNITTGLNLRLGPLCIGTNNMMPLFKGDITSFNFYAMLKVAIPHKRLKDRDHDGLIDKKDNCPDDPGELSLHGCPDSDHDQIPDVDDGCPHQAGIAAFRGCPDTDGDGIADAEDNCPLEKGSKALKGCPDRDQDGIIDKEDLCPALNGPLKYNGCPDSDLDLIHDGIDQCKDLAGAAENKGCPWPDADKDGTIDKLDSCVNIPGVALYKGCPEPVKLALVEKRVVEKAFSNLKFESAKDLIMAASLPYLDALAKLLLLHKTEWKIKLSGHTDNEGTEQSNLILSKKRVEAVQKYLVKKGVPEQNMILEWFGQGRPLADNLTNAGKQKNRRVEMTLLQSKE